MNSNAHQALAGIRILDLSRVLAGPLCTMMLADLGADVIKVESNLGGDDTRGWGPPFDDFGQSAYFLSINRNKLSIGADLASEADRALIQKLAADADVVIENALPGSLDKHEIRADDLLRNNPNLIWCTISGFGPHSQRPGYDFVLQAESGWMAITGPEGGPPYKVGVALVDVIAGKDAAIAILAALIARARKPPSEQRKLDVSLRASATAALVNVAQNSLVTGVEAKRWGNAHPNLVPYQLFNAADRPFVIAVGSDRQWAAAVQALALDTLQDDHFLDTNAGRVAQRNRVVQAISERVALGHASTWVDRLEKAGVPCGVVRGVLEALGDVTASAITGIAPAPGGRINRHPPGLNEHGEIIRRLHWSAFKEVPILG